MNRELLLSINAPTVDIDRNWALHDAEPLFPFIDAASFYSEHGDRSWLSSVAAEMGIPKHEGDYLGRWSASGSDEYVRFMQAVCFKVQHEITNNFRDGHVHGESDLGQEFGVFLVKKFGMDNGCQEAEQIMTSPFLLEPIRIAKVSCMLVVAGDSELPKQGKPVEVSTGDPNRFPLGFVVVEQEGPHSSCAGIAVPSGVVSGKCGV